MLAEQWARENNMKFPPIDAEMQYEKFGMKEFYVFVTRTIERSELPGCGSLCAG